MKTINYFLQSIIIYLFFFIGFFLRLKISRNFFAFIFSSIGPFFKSKKIIIKNFDIVSNKIVDKDKKEIIRNMWKNYGMTFIEYIFLKYFRKNNSHIIFKIRQY